MVNVQVAVYFVSSFVIGAQQLLLLAPAAYLSAALDVNVEEEKELLEAADAYFLVILHVLFEACLLQRLWHVLGVQVFGQPMIHVV